MNSIFEHYANTVNIKKLMKIAKFKKLNLKKYIDVGFLIFFVLLFLCSKLWIKNKMIMKNQRIHVSYFECMFYYTFLEVWGWNLCFRTTALQGLWRRSKEQLSRNPPKFSSKESSMRNQTQSLIGFLMMSRLYQVIRLVLKREKWQK